VKYRLKIARAEENELERLPLDVALQVESHLQQMAELAGESEENDPVWVGSEMLNQACCVLSCKGSVFSTRSIERRNQWW
jgi:hypothetical protein